MRNKRQSADGRREKAKVNQANKLVCYIDNLVWLAFRVLAPARRLAKRFWLVAVVLSVVSHAFPRQSTKLARNLLANISEPVIWPWIEMSVPSSSCPVGIEQHIGTDYKEIRLVS